MPGNTTIPTPRTTEKIIRLSMNAILKGTRNVLSLNEGHLTRNFNFNTRNTRTFSLSMTNKITNTTGNRKSTALGNYRRMKFKLT